jgi:hypothetical protein
VAAEINSDEFERRLRSPGANRQARWACWRNWRGSSILRRPYVRVRRGLRGRINAWTDRTEPPQPLEMATPNEPMETASVDIHASRASKFGDAYRPDPIGVDLAMKRRSGGWTPKVWVLPVAAGAALIGMVFALKGGAPGHSKAPPVVAAAEVSTKALQRRDAMIATSSDAGVSPLKGITQPAAVRRVISEEPPIELGDHASLGNAPASANLGPTSAGAAQSTAGASSGSPVMVAVNTPVVGAPFVAPPPAAPQFPDSKTLRTVSVRPGGTQIATTTPSATGSGEALHASDGPQPPAKPATKGVSEVALVAQPSTHKLNLPTKLSGKPSARLVVAKTETAAPGAEADKAPETPLLQQPANPLSHAFRYAVGAVRATAASAPQPAEQTAAHKSGDWAIQFAAQKSEAEAKVDVGRLNAKYAAALDGATIGVNKTLANGETIYALRVTGLSKAEATALCERLKGRDCFMPSESDAGVPKPRPR